jgi:GcrA cell cycle regulator
MIRWTPDRERRLRELWAAGYSGTQCANRLGGFSHCKDRGRSAVIGKANRLGLPARNTSTRTPHPTRKRPLSKEAKSARPSATIHALVRPQLPTSPLPPATEYDRARVSFLDLDKHHCKWAVGDPTIVGHAQPLFCGKDRHPGLPYCSVHARRAFVPPPSRRREAPVIKRELQVVA